MQSSEKAIKALSKALKKSADLFADGDVIRWVATHGDTPYTYAAVKSPLGWYTTSRTRSVGQVLTYTELIDVLGRFEVSAVEFSSGWTAV